MRSASPWVLGTAGFVVAWWVARDRPSGGRVRADATALAIVVGCAVPAAALKVYDIAFTDGWTRRASSTAAELTYLTAVFTLLGLVWDLAGDRVRWPVLAGGASLALLGLTPESEMEWAAVGVALVVATSTLFRGLARAPGRAGKVFCLAALVLLIPGGTPAPGIAIGLGAVAAHTLADLRGAVGSGSAAGMGMGAFIGWAITIRGTHIVWLEALGVIALLGALSAYRARTSSGGGP